MQGKGRHNKMRDERDIWEKGSREKGGMKRGRLQGRVGRGNGERFSMEGVCSLR